jgi:DNA sulfur modification protein DndD
LDVKIEHLLWEWVAEFGPQVIWEADGKKTGLIQIQNGYGKTTTLMLMQNIFSNVLPEAKTIREHLQPKGPDSLDKTVDKEFTGDNGRFEVGLRINGEKYSIGMDIFHDTHEARFYTITPKGREKVWAPPQVFRDVFEDNIELCKLFLFDAEIANEINKKLGNDTVQKSIMKLANLDPIELLIEPDIGALDKYIQNKIDASKVSSANKSAISKIDNILKKARGRKTTLEDELKEHGEEITKLSKERNELQKLVDEFQKDKDKEKRIKTLEGELGSIILSRNTRTDELLEKVVNPSNSNQSHWTEIVELFKKLEDMGVPDIGKQVLIDLLSEGICICGEDIEDGGEREKHIKKHIEEMMEGEYSSLVIAMRQEVNSVEQDSLVDVEIDGLKVLVTAIGTKETEIQRVKRRLTRGDAEGDTIEDMERRVKVIDEEDIPLFEELQKVISSRKLDEIKAGGWHCRAITRGGKYAETAADIEDSDNIHIIEKCIEKLLEKKSKLADIAARQEAVSKLKECTQKALNAVESSIKEKIMTISNDKLEIMHSQGGLKIASLENGLELTNITGRPQGGANAAAALVISYSFVTSLLQVAEVKVPMVFDSPTNPFGGGVASTFTRFVANELDSQSIHFIQSNEKLTYKYLYDNNASEISRCTIWRPDEEWKEDENGLLRLVAGEESLEINTDEKFYNDYDPVR